MKRLTTSLQEYLEIRRSFGYQLKETEGYLKNFISFLKKKGFSYITIKSALEWATLPQKVKRSCWSHRLSVVRLFSQHRAVEDPRTEVPSPHLFSQQ